MIITSLFLKNFGPFRECEVQFKPGLNIITGANGSGKTQLFGAIAFCVLGPKALQIVEGTPSESTVRLTCEKDKHRQIVEYQYLNGKFLKTFIDRKNAFVSDTIIRNYENLLYKYIPAFISDISFIKEIPDNQDFDLLTNIVADYTPMREQWDKIKETYEPQITETESKKIIINSMGEEWLLKLIKRLLLQIRNECPIVIDEPFVYLDENIINFIMGLLKILSQNNQIILFSSGHYIDTKYKIYSIPSEQAPVISSIYYKAHESIAPHCGS